MPSGNAIRKHLRQIEIAREVSPFANKLAVEREKLLEMAAAGHFADPLAALNASLDYLLLKDARALDQFVREARLTALKRELSEGETHQVQHEVDAYLNRHGLSAKEGTAERAVLSKRMMRAEIEVLQRTLERDRGNYGGKPSDPIVAPPLAEEVKPVSLSQLWSDYVKGRVLAGFLKDGGKRQEPVIRHLRSFLKHDNALRVTSKDLIAWRDHLLGIEKLAAKTVSDIYLSTVRSLFKWAHENEREKGFTDAEAVAILRASRTHTPKPNQFGYVRETSHMTAAKRWTPLLAAFSGARISEVTQLRKEDFREEGERWIMRITPFAGSVKEGGYRDVPLHKQIIAEGLTDFIEAAQDGPLFHGASEPKKYAIAAQSVSDEIAKWLQSKKLVPVGVRPNYGWRHRLKTQGLELGLTMRIIDAMQGHMGRTAGENYGDVTVTAKARIIDALPHYDLNVDHMVTQEDNSFIVTNLRI